MPKAGYLTPSTYGALMMNGKGNETFGKTAWRVIDQLVLDFLGVERDEDEPTPRACEWGLENEFLARHHYQQERLVEVRADEFTSSKEVPYMGGTTDGLVGKNGSIEIKNPFSPFEHMENIVRGKQITQYMPQLQGYFFIKELDWTDFISFDRRFPAPLNLSVQRVYRDDEYIKDIVSRCKLAYAMAQEKAESIRKMGGIQIA